MFFKSVNSELKKKIEKDLKDWKIWKAHLSNVMHYISGKCNKVASEALNYPYLLGMFWDLERIRERTPSL